MKYVADKNGHVARVSDAVETEMNGVPAPPEDSVTRGGSVNYKYDREAEEYVEMSQDQRTIYQKILDTFERWEGDRSEALDRFDQILSESSTLQIAVREGDSAVIEERLASISNQVLDQSEKQELIDLVT